MIKVARGCLGEEELEEVKEAFSYGYFGLAYKVEQFEKALQEYLGVRKEVIAVNNGTAALHLALDSLGLQEGDEVLVPSFTFAATVQAITMCHAVPVFCDIEEQTLLMDLKDAEQKITPKTKAILPVHYAGQVCDMDTLSALSDSYGLRLIEDAAHAIGSTYHHKKVGAMGDITCFSFDSIKVMTCGEGGALVLEDQALAHCIRQKRMLGMERKSMHSMDWKKREWFYDVVTPGYRYHMSNINAAIGLAQLRKLDLFLEKRKQLCKDYVQLLQDQKEVELLPISYEETAPFMFVVKIKNKKRDPLRKYLMDHEIETGISYIPAHFFTLYQAHSQPLPRTEQIFPEILSLPLHYELTHTDLVLITNTIIQFFQTASSTDFSVGTSKEERYENNP